MFRELDPELWRAVGQNPVALLERLNYEKLEALSVDKEMLGKINAIYDRFTEYMSVKPDKNRPSVAYFWTVSRLLTMKLRTSEAFLWNA